MFWRLWWRAISVKRSQAALALGALVVGAAITAMLLNLYSGVRRKMTDDIRSYGANVVIDPSSADPSGNADGNKMLEQSSLTTLVQFVRAMPGASFATVLYGVVRVSPDPANPRLPEFTNVVAAGADLAELIHLNPGWHETGYTISRNLPAGECAVGSALAARLHLQPGDSLQVRRATDAEAANTAPATIYRLATILTTGTSEDDQIFLPLPALQALLGLTGQVTLVEMSIPGESREVETAVHRLSGLLPGLDVRPIRQIVYSEGKVLGTIRWLLLSLTILILVIIAVCVMATMTAIVLERRKDIGVMKALGAADALLMRLFMTEGAAVGLVGGILGYAVGALVARVLAMRLFGVTLDFNLWTLPVVCGLSVALAIISAQVPVRIVRAIEPTVVLKGE